MLTLGETLKRYADERPNDPAILYQSGINFSFSDLERSAAKVRDLFREAGLGPRARVAIAVPDGPVLASSIVAVACNAAALPLDGRLTAREFDELFGPLGVEALITTPDSSPTACDAARKVGAIIFEAALDGKQLSLTRTSDAHGRVTEEGPNPIAVILRTSGTTARQKLVPVTHSYIASMSNRMKGWFDLTPQDRCFCGAPLFYGHGVMGGLLTSLYLGNSVAFNSGDCNFLEALGNTGATWYAAGPTFHHHVMQLARKWQGSAPRLRFVQSAAAFLSDKLRQQIEDFFAVPVIDVYGMSEAGLIAGNGILPSARKAGTVGKPDLTAFGIFGPDGSKLPVGEVGEVRVKGPSVTPGYLLDDAANAAAFKDGWLCTGDLGLLDEEGFLTLKGRLKEMINRGGEKIAPAEVDLTLMKHDAVAEAAAFTVPHPTLGEDIAAAVVLKGAAKASEQELRAFLKAQIAPFKVPRRIHFVSSLPKGGTGKVLRSKLTEQFAPAARTREAAPPETELEANLLAVWERTLERDDIGIDDDFFEVGGDSLASLQMLVEAERLTNKKIADTVLFEAPTIRQLARLIEGGQVSNRPLIIKIQAGEAGERPLFFFDGVFNGAGYYTRDLAVALGRQQPFFSMRPFPLVDGKLPTIEEMVKKYVGLIKSASSGPYRIGGHCNGAVIAFGVARALEDMGETVERLIIVDPISLNARREFRMRAGLSDLVSTISGRDVMTRRVGDMIRVWDNVLLRDYEEYPSDDGRVGSGAADASEELAPLFDEAKVMRRQLTRALAGFIPKRVRAPVVCFVAKESAGSIRHSPDPWRSLCRDFRAITVPGAHLSCITTYGGELARELGAVLNG